ncbi:hypothetical protein [Kibdelosporangium philippinense]
MRNEATHPALAELIPASSTSQEGFPRPPCWFSRSGLLVASALVKLRASR